MALGLVVVRLLVGLLFVGHGTQKLFGWFGGHGPEGTGGFFESLGYRRGKAQAILAGSAEALGGLLFALGLFVPVAAALIIAVMVNAIVAVHAENGLWVSDGGMEYPLVLVALAFGITWATDGGEWALLSLLAGVVAGGVALALRQPEDEEAVVGEEEPAAERESA